MSKYLNRLNQDKDEAKKASAKVAEAGAKASVQQKVAGLTAQAATLEAAYEAALGSVPFNIDRVVNLTKEIAQNDSDLKTVQGILDTEFAD